MKKLFISLVLVLATVVNANAMSKYRASREARFLTDKMAWELDLSYSQMEDVYEINYDYFRSLVSVYSNYSYAYEIRNEELQFVLTPRQWARFMAIEYFYVPVIVRSYSWVFPIYSHYTKSHFYYDAPHAYSHYTGGHANNKDFYRGRIEIHTHAHNNGYKPQSSGNIGHAHGMTREEANRHRQQNAAPVPAPQHSNNHNNGNAKPQGNNHQATPAPQHNSNLNNGSTKPQSGNNTKPQGNAAPNRNTSNRANTRVNSNNTNTRVNSNNSSNNSARPTRSQNAQSNGSHSTTSGRR